MTAPSATPEFREVLIMRELEELSYREIAAAAAIPVGTVMSRLARARQKLQAVVLTQGNTAHPMPELLQE
jgi:RNA polymerase sigma-70 factor (ECF subfamily)